METWDDILRSFYEEDRRARAFYTRPPIIDVWLVENFDPPVRKQLGLPVQTSGYSGPAEQKAPELTLCGVCKQPIHKDELGGIDKEHGFMHQKCMPLNLIS